METKKSLGLLQSKGRNIKIKIYLVSFLRKNGITSHNGVTKLSVISDYFYFIGNKIYYIS